MLEFKELSKDLYLDEAADYKQWGYDIIGPYLRSRKETKSGDRLKNRKAFLKYLKEFYQGYAPKDPGARLILRRVGIFGAFFVTSQDSDIIDILKRADRAKKLKIHRAEMIKFVKFLEGKKF